MRWFRECWISALWTLLGASLLILPAVGRAASTAAKAVTPSPLAEKSKETERTVGPFTGRVVDMAGKPVAKATVWLIGGSHDAPRIVAETTSDEKGLFYIAKQTWSMSTRSQSALSTMLAARDSAGRIGGSTYYNRSEFPDDASKKEFRIKLHDVKDLQGRLVDRSGQPIAGATVRAIIWSRDYDREEQIQHIVYLPDRFAEEWTTKSGADGRFTLRKLPTVGRVGVKITAEGFGQPRAYWNVERPLAIELGRVGAIQGAVTCRHDPKAAAEIKLRLSTELRSRGVREEDAYLYYSADTVTKKDGSLRFENVPPGKYSVLPELFDTPMYYSDDGGPTEVKPGETARASIALKQAARLKGRVIDRKTGAGVPGVNLMLCFDDGRGRGDGTKTVTSDANGAFTLYCRPCKGSLQIWQIPPEYLNLSGQQQTIEVKEDATLEPICLDRANALEGIVVDEAGKPVAGANICCKSVSRDDSYFSDRDVRTNRDGKFLLRRVTPKSHLNIRARTDRAASEPVNVVVGESKGPVRLVVDEATSCAVQGTVVDDAGRPVPKVKVELILHLWFGNSGMSFRCESCTTGADGKFRIGGLWAGDGYDLRVSAEDYEPRGSRQMKGTTGEVLDFGKIVLLSTGGVVEGKALDSSGKPLADVRVFNSGDAPEPLQTRTDDAGKFRLKGFRKGTVFVVAEKQGYRFTGLRTTCGVADGVLKMLRTDEPPPKWSAPAPPADDVQQRQKATRKLLELLSNVSEAYVRDRARQQLAALDAKQAAANKKEPAVKKPDAQKKNDITTVAEEDVDEALSMLPQDAGQAFQQVMGLARHFADSDHEKAQRFASEAVIRSRNLDDPNRVLTLAESGALVWKLGNKEAGAKLVREAGDMAAKWASSDQREWQIGAVAKTIAPVDLPLALGIAKKIKKNARDSCLADIAMGLDDVAAAESVLKEIEGWYAGRARGRLAYRIAGTKPADAVRLIEAMPSDYGREDLTKAAAFGWLATVIAPKDPKLAHRLIDRAFAIHLHPSDPTQYLAGERAAQPALLGIHARMAGYPDMESVIFRVMATRVTTKNTWSPVAVQESAVSTALFLALLDRTLAKEMLQAVEPYSDSLGTGGSGIGVRDWLRAWALVDPPHAVELAQHHLATAKDENAKRWVWSTAQEMIELWGGTPDDAVKRFSRDYINVFSPYER
jgi:protocatechuate 3,4-dioxygenase beta subunit